jgi:hypothetical protein
MRASGTIAVAVLSQIAIQIRILQIVWARLVFMKIEKTYPEVSKRLLKEHGFWDTQIPSEKYLRSLQRMPQPLKNPQPPKQVDIGSQSKPWI